MVKHSWSVGALWHLQHCRSSWCRRTGWCFEAWTSRWPIVFSSKQTATCYHQPRGKEVAGQTDISPKYLFVSAESPRTVTSFHPQTWQRSHRFTRSFSLHLPGRLAPLPPRTTFIARSLLYLPPTKVWCEKTQLHLRTHTRTRPWQVVQSFIVNAGKEYCEENTFKVRETSRLAVQASREIKAVVNDELW